MQGMDREIAENYGLEVRGLIPYKDTFLIVTPKGKKVLKKLAFSPERLLYVHGAKEHLFKKGFTNIDRYLCNLQGKPYFTVDNVNYAVSDFLEGRECSFDNDGDVQKAAGLLASMHRASKGYIPPEGCKLQDELGRLPGYFGKRLEDIKKLKKQAKRGKGRFDHLFIEYVDYFCSIGEAVVSEIGNCGYDRLVEAARAERGFCHHDYTHHNIVVTDNRMSVINFDYCCFELKIYDLANFLRRKMRKCNWEQDNAAMIIESYCAIEPLTGDDLAVMRLILQFPQKFWRVVNRYYNSRRSWSERSYMSKLQEVISEVDYHKKFMENYDKMIH